MVASIRFNQSSYLQAQKLSARRPVSDGLIQALGGSDGLDNASKALLAGATSGTTAQAILASGAIQSRLQEEGNLELINRLAPQIFDQNLVSVLATGNGGLTLRDQSSLVALGLKSLSGPRGSTVNFRA
jgi:hypothetical protein